MTGSNFTKILCAVVGAALSLVMGSAHAEPLVITETAVATGTLGAFTFTDALLTITVDQVYSERSKTCSTPGTTVIGTCTGEFGIATVSIAGVGTAFLTDTIAAFINTRGGYGLLGSAGISDESLNNPAGTAIFNTSSSIFGSYYFDYPIGPITGAVAYINADPIPTTLGDLRITSILNNISTFTAVEAVPVPATLPLFASGLVCIGALCWRRRRKQTAV